MLKGWLLGGGGGRGQVRQELKQMGRRWKCGSPPFSPPQWQMSQPRQEEGVTRMKRSYRGIWDSPEGTPAWGDMPCRLTSHSTITSPLSCNLHPLCLFTETSTGRPYTTGLEWPHTCSAPPTAHCLRTPQIQQAT